MAYLAVSLFSARMQGRAVRGHVDGLNALGFQDCIVVLGDTLHRFNLPLDETGEPGRHARALALGEAWIGDNGEALADLKPPWRLMRHDEMLALDAFVSVRAALEDFLDEHAPLREALAADILTFGGRTARLGAPAPDASRAYLLEELAADIALAQRRPYAYIYPGTPPSIYRAMQQAPAPASLQGLERCLFVSTKVRSDGRVRFPSWLRTPA